MSHPIRIEQYDIYLWELTDLEYDDLIELEQHLTLSAKKSSPRFTQLLKDLRHCISSLDGLRSA
jgi:hypothetical protein